MNDYGRILFLALNLGLGATACDQPAPDAPDATDTSEFRALIGVGTGSGLTLNTSAWVSAGARDIYEFSIAGSWHTNSYDFETKYNAIFVPNTPYGPVTTQVGPPPQNGVARAVMLPGDEFAVNVLGPNAGDTTYRLTGAELIGLELTFRVKGFDDVNHAVKIKFADHIEDDHAGDFFELVRVDPTSGAPLAPVCEADSNGYRLARIYDGLSVDSDTGEMSYVGGGVHHIACTASAPAKSVLFGYNPTMITEESFTLVNRVVRADYCADGHPYTYPSNLVGIEDNFSPGQVGKTLDQVIQSLGPDEAIEAVWDRHGVLCVGSPRTDGVEREDVLCPIKQFADGQVSYSWQPPSCQGFVDDNPNGEIRFFSKSQG